MSTTILSTKKYKVGSFVRYRGIGAGEIRGLADKLVQGEQKTFATIFFAHKAMSAQIPLSCENQPKICPIATKNELKILLGDIKKHQITLPRNWDQREELSAKILNKGEPKDWISLLGAYAQMESEGISVVAGDYDAVMTAIELLGAELAGARKIDINTALDEVQAIYQKAIKN